MEPKDYPFIAIIIGIIGFIGYSWFKTQEIEVLTNQALNIVMPLFGVIILVLLLVYIVQNNPLNQKRIRLSKIITLPSLFIGLILTSTLYFKIDYWNFSIELFFQTIQKYSFVIISIIVTITTTSILTTFRQNKKQKIKELITKVEEISKEPQETFEDIEQVREKINQIIMQHEKHLEYIESRIQILLESLNTKENMLTTKHIQEQQKQYNKIKQLQHNNQLINKIFNYFQEVYSTETIPTWAKHIDYDLIREAEQKYKEIQNKKHNDEWSRKFREREQEEANRFILKHKNLPSNYTTLKEHQQEYYDNALEQLRKGTLQEAIKVLPEDDELASKNFFLPDELSKEQKERFIQKYGYRHKPFTYLDGTLGNNLIIKNNSKTESDYHFCTKHLISKIDEDHALIEYTLEDQRADIVFNFSKDKIAVEIETGSNNKDQVEKKIDWLNKYFKYWIITAPKSQHKKYKQYVNNKTSFCLGMKKTALKIVELKRHLTPIHPSDIYNIPTVENNTESHKTKNSKRKKKINS